MARAFKDSDGVEWTPRVTTLTLIKFEEKTGLNFLRTLQQPGGLANVLSSLTNIFTLAFHACANDVESRDVAFEAFCSKFSGNQLEGLARSVGEAINDFLPESVKTKEDNRPDPQATSS